MKTLAEETFNEDIDGWLTFAMEGASSNISRNPDGKLCWNVDTGPEQAAVIVYHWQELANADGLTIRLESKDRFAFLVLGLKENDGSVYSLVIPVSKGEYCEYDAPFKAFSLQLDSEDENDRLDRSQLSSLNIIDISSHIASPGPNTIMIHSITLWTGSPDINEFFCTGPGNGAVSGEFRKGIDANFVLQGERQGNEFMVGKGTVDPLELFAANGANSFRLRLWVGEEGDSKLNYATELGLRVRDAGLKPYLVLFLSEDWSDVNKQPIPSIWADLTLDERVESVREYARETVSHFIRKEIEFDFYEIGNEIDYGICGVFADTTHPRDVDSLRKDTWPDEAKLIKAAIEGIKAADPEARIMLHIACSWDPLFTRAFYQSMIEFGVEYDYCGISYYPTAFGVITASRLCEVMDSLHEIGKPVIIAETAYPAEPPSGGLFGDWRRPVPGYPLTPEGQAWWLKSLFEWMESRGDVLGVYVFSPEFYFSGEIWSDFALFDEEGRARPAIAAFQPY